MDDNAREATAYHEAGHAVAAVWLHRPITRATIDSDAQWLDEDAIGGTGGAAPLHGDQWEGYEHSFTEADRRRVEREVMCLLAGPLVEEQHVGAFNKAGAGIVTFEGTDRVILWEGGDYRKIVFLSETVGGNDEENAAYVEWLRLRTLRLVGQHDFRVMVDAVAAELLARGSLSGRRVHAVAKGAVRRESDERFAEWQARLCHPGRDGEEDD